MGDGGGLHGSGALLLDVVGCRLEGNAAGGAGGAAFLVNVTGSVNLTSCVWVGVELGVKLGAHVGARAGEGEDGGG